MSMDAFWGDGRRGNSALIKLTLALPRGVAIRVVRVFPTRSNETLIYSFTYDHVCYLWAVCTEHTGCHCSRCSNSARYMDLMFVIGR